ncbi:MAG: hypothetical protein R3A10_22710 [Caldilineaceae bacterium]
MEHEARRRTVLVAVMNNQEDWRRVAEDGIAFLQRRAPRRIGADFLAFYQTGALRRSGKPYTVTYLHRRGAIDC